MATSRSVLKAMNRRALLGGGLVATVAAAMTPLHSLASGQDEPPIAEVELEEPADDAAADETPDLEYTVSSAPVAFTIVGLLDGDMKVSIDVDAATEVPALSKAKGAGGPIAVASALFRALGVEE